MKIQALALLIACALAGGAHAESKPAGNPYDARVRFVNYNPNDVVRVIGHFGFSTTIEFGEGEEIQSVALGDSLAWDVAPKGNHLFIKPRENNPTTNMAVVTNRRTYQFWLAGQRAKDGGRGAQMYFAVKFRYPEDERKKAVEAEERRVAQAALNAPPVPKNWDYWGCGKVTLRPSEVFDDGRFTYLRFPAAQEVPAAYIINSDGSEALANGTMRGDQLVLQLVAPKIILRKGRAVACVENRSYNYYGVYTPNSTTSPSVRRVVKDEAQGAPRLPVRPQVEEPAAPAEASPFPALPGALPTVPPAIEKMNVPTTPAGDTP